MSDDPQDFRDIVCPHCGGDGGWETEPYEVCRQTGSVSGHWQRCRYCDGRGSYMQEVEPITLEDLEDIRP